MSVTDARLATSTPERSAVPTSRPARRSVKPKFHLARHVTSRHDSTRSTCRASRVRRVERVERCCSTSSTQPKCLGSTCRTCRGVSRRDVASQVEFGLKSHMQAVSALCSSRANTFGGAGRKLIVGAPENFLSCPSTFFAPQVQLVVG